MRSAVLTLVAGAAVFGAVEKLERTELEADRSPPRLEGLPADSAEPAPPAGPGAPVAPAPPAADPAPIAPPRQEAPECVELPPPEPVDGDPLPSAEPLGPIEAVRSGDFVDDYLASPSGRHKIGTRREWGSTIVFFGQAGATPGMNETNVIDANDTGREVQVALYDPIRLRQGCAWDASCRSDTDGCGGEITFLGWNPVQGGNECNHGGRTEAVHHEVGRLESVVRPLFWNPDLWARDCRNDACKVGDAPGQQPETGTGIVSDVSYRQRLRFVAEHVVEMWMEYTNLSAVEHPPMIQEFPTVYSSFGKVGPDLSLVIDSQGEQVPIDQPANDGFFTRVFLSPGGFAALQNEELDYGVGLYHENGLQLFQAWQRKGSFNNVRARFEFGLPAHATVRGRAYLIIGGFEQIRRAAAALGDRLAPFGELELPAADAIVTRRLRVSGWVLDNRIVEYVDLVLDGRPIARVVPDQPRPDVCTLWPGYYACPDVGFQAAISLRKLSSCPHLLEVKATDSDGNQRTIARRRFIVSDEEDCRGDCDPPIGTHPIYRYHWSRGGDADHQFSRSSETPPDYAAEGVGFSLFSEPEDGLLPLWQSYCAECTDHMQSTDPEEDDDHYANAVLLGYCSAVRSAAAPVELRRLWSASATNHFVSADPEEQQAALAGGYEFESSCWVP